MIRMMMYSPLRAVHTRRPADCCGGFSCRNLYQNFGVGNFSENYEITLRTNKQFLRGVGTRLPLLAFVALCVVREASLRAEGRETC